MGVSARFGDNNFTPKLPGSLKASVAGIEGEKNIQGPEISVSPPTVRFNVNTSTVDSMIQGSNVKNEEINLRKNGPAKNVTEIIKTDKSENFSPSIGNTP